MTSSPFPIPKANKDKCKAPVQEFKATAYLAPVYSTNFFSNNLVFGPVVNQPDFKVSITSFSSSSVIKGNEKLRKVDLMGLPVIIAGLLKISLIVLML